jgi:hypothetical protein
MDFKCQTQTLFLRFGHILLRTLLGFGRAACPNPNENEQPNEQDT